MGFLLIGIAVAGYLLYKGYGKTQGSTLVDTPTPPPKNLAKILGGAGAVVATAGKAAGIVGAAGSAVVATTLATTPLVAGGSVGASALSTVLAQSGIAVPSAGAVATPISGGVSPLGSSLGGTAMLAVPWTLGSALTKLLAGKTYEQWVAEDEARLRLEADFAAYRASQPGGDSQIAAKAATAATGRTLPDLEKVQTSKG